MVSGRTREQPFTSSIILLVYFTIHLSITNGIPKSKAGIGMTLCTSPSCVHSASDLLSWRNATADPCENFFEFACGHYDSLQVMQPSFTFWNQFRYTQEYVDTITKEILSQKKDTGDPEALNKAKDVFWACMNTDKINERGVAPLLDLLRSYGDWPVLFRGIASRTCGCRRGFNWYRAAYAYAQINLPIIFNVAVRSNFYNASQLVTYIQFDNLPTPVPLLSPGQVDNTEDIPWEFTTDWLEEKKAWHQDKEAAPQPTDSDNLYVQFLSKMIRAIWSSLPQGELNSFPHQEGADEAVRVELRKVTAFMSNLMKITSAPTKGKSSGAGIPGLENPQVSGVMSIRSLQEYTDKSIPNPVFQMDWLRYLQNLFAHSDVTLTPDDQLYVEDLDKTISILKLVDSTEQRTLDNFLGSRVASFLGPETTDELWSTAKWFYQKLKYITEDYPRWMHCNHVVTDYPNVGLSMAIASKFNESYFQKAKLDKAIEMINDIQASFEDILQETNWMDDTTKSYALEKARYILKLVGFPEWISNKTAVNEFYKELQTDSSDHFGNVMRLRSFLFAQGVGSLREKRNRNEWTQSPFTVNAFYNTLNNRITFPVGIMNRPFFLGEDVEALDYGRIGSIIGHEITHGFDNQGRLFDKEGTFYNWWSDNAYQQYQEKAQCFIDQYSNFTDPDTAKKVDGKKTLAENIADNGGLREAYRAYVRKLSRRNKTTSQNDHFNCGNPSGGTEVRLPGLQHYSNKQLFFMGFATTWCNVGRSAQSKNDNHAPNSVRVLASLSNMVEFAEAWSCPKGSLMNPEKKCVLW